MVDIDPTSGPSAGDEETRTRRTRVVVIGAGFGGLALAIRLQSAGIQTTVIEARDKPGGRAYVYEDQGFVFDAGPTVMTMRDVFDGLFALAGERLDDHLRLTPLRTLARLLAHSYQLQAQLTTVKTMLLQRRGRLIHAQIDLPLKQTAENIEAALTGRIAPTQATGRLEIPTEWTALSDPFEGDLSPWLLRRLQLADRLALQLRAHADQAANRHQPRSRLQLHPVPR